MTKEEYEKLPEKQKKVFKIIFSGGYHTARNIRASLGDVDMNVSTLVQSLNEKDKNVCSRWGEDIIRYIIINTPENGKNNKCYT